MFRLYSNKVMTQKNLLILVPICILLLFISKINYLLFHTIVEISIISICFSTMLIAFGTIKLCESNSFAYLGLIYGFISMIDLLHTLTYKGINIITSSANIPTQLWIAQSYYESISLLVSLYYFKSKSSFKNVLIINTIIVILLLGSIFGVNIFPDCYIEGYGLTKFKIYSEYIICILLIIITILYNKNKKCISLEETTLFNLVMLYKILSHLLFTSYLSVYSFSNFLGHVMNFISFYYFFIILFKAVILDPYKTLFKKVHSKAIELEEKNKELALTKATIEKDFLEYRKLIDFLPDGIIIWKYEKIIYANNRVGLILNIDDISKLNGISIYELFDCSYHDQIRNRLKNQDGSTIEYNLSFGDKETSVEVNTMRYEYEEGCFLSVIRDITDRKKAEEINLVLQEREKEENLKNEFFANISHELKTPINVIYTATQLGKSYLEKQDINSIIKYNQVIRKNCLRLIRIINNMIDITRIETGFFKPALRVENIVSLVENITQSVISHTDFKNINIVFDTEFEELYVNCDADLIERIMLNLFSNAVKYGKQNGNIEINIYKIENSYVKISVKDDGIGIPEDQLCKLFKKFEKVDKSMSRNTEGSGIGLAITKSFIEMQNGTISVKSKVNEGTEFIITLPIVEGYDEVCAAMVTNETKSESNIIEKTHIEFSDIYS